MRIGECDSRPKSSVGSLPLDDVVKVLVDQALIILFDILHANRLIRLGVQIVWVEVAHGSQQLVVFRLRQVRIPAFTMPPIMEKDVRV